MMEYLVFLGAAAQLYGIIIYIKEMIQGKTKPNRVTWLMWSIAPLIGTAAAVNKGVGWAVLPVFMAGFGPLIVFVTSFFCKDGYWKLKILDYLCGVASVLALVLWWITKEPLIAIVFSILGDGFAALPTVFKSWKNPETESVEAYTTGLFSALTCIFAIKMWSVSEIAFPAYLIIVNIVLITIIYNGKRRKVNTETSK